MNRVKINQYILDNAKFNGRKYLEIGVAKGGSFLPIVADVKLGVDIVITNNLKSHERRGKNSVAFCCESSDEFFNGVATGGFEAYEYSDFLPPNLVFVDGLHEWEQAYRDIVNSFAVFGDDTIATVHDCLPRTETAATPKLADARKRSDYTGAWNGDVWKAITKIRMLGGYRAVTLDCDYGIGIVFRDASATTVGEGIFVSSLGWNDFVKNKTEYLGLIAPEMLPAVVNQYNDTREKKI